MFKLRRLKIDRYRNVKPCEIHFSNGSNVLVGLNGSGKTTLLRLLNTLLCDSINNIAPGEALDVEFDAEVPFGRATARFWREHSPNKRNSSSAMAMMTEGMNFQEDLNSNTSDFSQKIVFSMSLRDKYEFGVSFVDGLTTFYIGGVSAPPSNTIGKQFSFYLFLFLGILKYYENSENAESIDNATACAASMRKFVRFDESLEFLESIYTSTCSFTINRSGETSAKDALWMPSDYYKLIISKLSEAPRELVVTSSEVYFLKRFVALTGLHFAHFRCELIEKRTSEDDATSSTYGRFRFSFTRLDGSIFPQEHLSYGQKRLLAFLLYISANPMIVVADELADGLHYSWIEACMEEIGERQAIMASQNPLLFEHIAFNSPEHVQQSIILCESYHDGIRATMSWRNFSAEEASSFYGAYKTEVQQVSEILRSEGLW